jgi:hypothetical protein
MKYFNLEFRQDLCKRLMRRYIKESKKHFKELDYYIYEYLILTLREDFSVNKEYNQMKRVQKFFMDFEKIIDDLKRINTNIEKLKVFQYKNNF